MLSDSFSLIICREEHNMMNPLDPFGLDLKKNTLIQASAGTGKTYTITTLVIRLLAEGYSVESLLVVTFTEAAAAELKLRIRQRLVQVIERLDQSLAGQIKEKSCLTSSLDQDPLVSYLLNLDQTDRIRAFLAHALTCFDQASIMTIHSFCFQVLRSHAFESGIPFDMTLAPDVSQFVRQILLDFFMVRISSLDWLSLAFLDSRNVSPDSFSRDLKPIISRPNIEVIPRSSGFVDVSDKWERICHKIRKILAEQSQELIEMIRADEGIKKNSYSRKNVPVWIQAALAQFEAHGKNCPLFDMKEKGDSLYKFSSRRIEEQTKDGYHPLSHELFELCQQLVDLTKTLEQNLAALQWECMKFCQKELARIRERQGFCFFDDLINDLAAALNGPQKEYVKKAVQSTYKACLIDEFQDTDAGQYTIFSQLFGSAGFPFFMIGDPKQAIYAFRGGDIFTYLSAVKDSEQQFTLHTNYRSSAGLVRAVNEIFSSVDDPFLFPGIEFTKVAPCPAKIHSFVKEDQAAFRVSVIDRNFFSLDRKGFIKKEDALGKLPAIVADQILSDLGNPAFSFINKEGNHQNPEPSHMAVLVRTNAQAQDIYQALSRSGVPCFVARTGSVFSSPEAEELYEVMTAVAFPAQVSCIKAALTTSVFGYSIEQLSDLDEDSSFMEDWQETFFYFHTLWHAKGFVSMIMALIHWPETLGRPESAISERGLTNIFHLVELISCAQQQKELSIPLLLDWLARQLYESTRQESEDELRLESDKKAVAIITIHRSKGMEYPIVYLPYLWEYRKPSSSGAVLFHDRDRENSLCLDLCPESEDVSRSLEFARQEASAEDRRLLYVALTRASFLCRVFWAGVSGAEKSALGQIIHPNGCENDSDMKKDWKTIEDRAEGNLIVEDFVFQSRGPCQSQEDLPGILSYREFNRNISPAFFMTSFTGIVSGAKENSGSWDQDAKGIESNEIFFENLETDFWGDGFSSGKMKKSPRILLGDFPKGAASGDFFHRVFEDLDFPEAKRTIEDIAKKHFQEFGFENLDLLNLACKAVLNVLETPLGAVWGENFCLGQISEQDRLTELEFVFPIRNVRAAELAAALEKNSLCKEYASRIKKFGYHALQGFIKGFMDLVFQYNGKWYLLDYKSNFLGETYQDYDQENILQVMESHDYFLQYHIYLVALHRYLKLRLEDYEYSRDFGGVMYLFIRGITGKQDGTTGLFYDRPSWELVESLDQVFA